jgi:hypothetical protein
MDEDQERRERQWECCMKEVNQLRREGSGSTAWRSNKKKGREEGGRNTPHGGSKPRQEGTQWEHLVN